MGNKVGRSVAGMAAKPVRDYNIEERAEKAILANKYSPSPNYPGTRDLIDESIQNLPPEARKELEVTSEGLGRRLQDIFVTSRDQGRIEPRPRETPSRPLPKERTQPAPWEYGPPPPAVTPYGRITIKDALAMVAEHAQDPNASPGVTAMKYKLDTQLTEAVLKHFGTYRLITPVEKDVKGEDQELYLSTEPVPEVVPSELPYTDDTRRMLSVVALSHQPQPGDSYVPSEKIIVPTAHPDNTDPEDTRTLLHPGSEEEWREAEKKLKDVFTRESEVKGDTKDGQGGVTS